MLENATQNNYKLSKTKHGGTNEDLESNYGCSAIYKHTTAWWHENAFPVTDLLCGVLKKQWCLYLIVSLLKSNYKTRVAGGLRIFSPMWPQGLITPARPAHITMTSSNGNIFALLALCAGNSSVTGEFPTQRPVTRLKCFLWSVPD